MKRQIVFLHPLGAQGSPITSQTLFGATCWALAVLGEDVGALLRDLERGPRFAFSNAFPYLRRSSDATPLLLLPKPPLRPPIDVVNRLAGNTDSQQIQRAIDLAKRVQKARYISQGVAEELRTGRRRAADLLDDKLVELAQSTFFLKAEAQSIWGKNGNNRRKKLWERAIVQRNSIDRVAGATAEGLLFQEELTFFRREKAGLWAALWADDVLWPKLEAALRYIADTGLGGERAVGKGHFQVKVEAWETCFPGMSGQTRFINLSEYIPAVPNETIPLAYELRHIRQKAENRHPDGAQRVYVARLCAYAPGGVFEYAGSASDLCGRLLPLGQVGMRQVYYSGLTIPLWGKWEV